MRRARARRTVVLVGVILTVLIIAGAIALPAIFQTLRDERVDTRASPTPSPRDTIFPAFWSVTTLEEAERIQLRVDDGEDPWRKDPFLVARRFAGEFIGWQKLGTTDFFPSGSAEGGWSAEVIFQPVVGEATDTLGTPHHLMLIGLKGNPEPAWFVTSFGSEKIVVETPKDREVVSSPLRVTGRGLGFEGTIETEVRDDKDRSLHKGFLTAGSTEPAPFTAQLEFDSPSTRSGILIFRAASGLEGPPPEVTILRLRFR